MDSSQPPSPWFKPTLLWLAPALLLVLGVAVIVFDGLGLESGLANRLFDAYQRHAARPFADVKGLPVRVLELPALDEDRLVEITRTLSGQGVRMVVLTAPVESGPSPQSLSARLPPGSEAARAALAGLPEPGHELAEAIAHTNAILPVMLGETGRAPHLKAGFVYRGTSNPFGSAPRFEAASAPPPILEANAAGLAAANVIPDPDGVVRHMPLVLRDGAGLVPCLAAEALRVVEGNGAITMVSDEHDPMSFLSGIGLAALETANGPIPTDASGRIWLNYAASRSERMLNPNALAIQPLKDAIVVVGMEGDVVTTPLGPSSVAQVIGEAIENLAGADVLHRPDWTRPAEALVLIVLGAATLFLLRLSPGWAAVLVLAAPGVLALTSWYLYAAHRLLTDWLTPTLFLALVFAAGSCARLQDRKRIYEGLRLAFSDSLAPSTLEKIARRPDLLRLDGEVRTITYLACGLAVAGGEIAPGLKTVLTPLIDLVLARGGTLDRVTADGFAAYWNAPLEDGDHAPHACDAAEAMAKAAREMTQHRPDNVPPFTFHAGLATGTVTAGGLGGHINYAVQGEVVALAEQLQRMARRYGFTVIAAGETQALADRSFAFLEIDRVAGAVNQPVTLYAVLGDLAVHTSPKFRALSVFHDHIFTSLRQQNWRAARELIAQCRRLSGANQRLYDLHLARIAYYEKNPPVAGWDGAFRPILE